MPAESNVVLALAAVTVGLPVCAAAVVVTGACDRRLRDVAVAALLAALLAAGGVTMTWNLAGGRPITIGSQLAGGSLVAIDGLSTLLMPYAAFVSLAILLAAPRRALDAAGVARTLAGTGATLAMFATSHPFAILALWLVTAALTWVSTRATPGGRGAARVFAIAMTTATAAMTVGTGLLISDPPWERASGPLGIAGGWLVAVAVMIRKGIVPFHSWYPALFSGAPMSAALAATMPQVAAYSAVRLLIGHVDHAAGLAPELEFLSNVALVTAVYGAALALVQRELRGFIGFLAMSQSAMVLAGLSGTLPLELSGALCVWISSGLSLTGIGLVTWALESRAGPIRLDTPQGRFWDAPALAAFFLLFGLAGSGLPGTLSFVADDLIVSGSLDEKLYGGLLVTASTVLSGIAVMRCWFFVFGGPTALDGPRHAILRREQLALSALLLTLFALGLVPDPLVRAIDRAAEQLLHPVSATSIFPASVSSSNVPQEIATP
ncbi:MAG: proton-conducting transporter membrane subunit [Pirellulales bacterium]